MPKYNVEFPLIHKGKKYMPDKTVEMSEKLAEPLLAEGDISSLTQDDPPTPQSEAAEQDDIVKAIGKLDINKENKKHWTGKGLPQVAALEEILKEMLEKPVTVSADARTEAFEIYTKSQPGDE